MEQTKDEVISEIREIFADAVAGHDLEHFESRLSIATTKLDVLADEACSGMLRFLVKTLDTIRKNVGDNPEKAHYYTKCLQAIVNDDTKGAEDAIADFSVRDFLNKLS